MIEFLSRLEIIFTLVILAVTIVIHRFVIWSTARLSKDLNRSKLRRQYINRYVGYFVWSLASISIIFVWGISKDGFWTALASTFAVIGVALFANWSILSNLTSSIIIYFAFPYKIGDRIRIHDKDLPVTGVIEDVKGFFTVLITNDGEMITYPNNLLLQKGVSILGNKKESVFDIEDDEDDSKSS